MRKLLFIVFLFWTTFAQAQAHYYWIGGGTNSNWNSTPVGNWSLTNGGAVTANPIFIGNDDLYFTSLSGSGNSIINTDYVLNSLHFTVGYIGTITHNSGFTLQVIRDGLSFLSGMTYTIADKSCTIYMSNEDGTTQNFNSAGKTIGTLVYSDDAGGGTLLLQNNLTLIGGYVMSDQEENGTTTDLNGYNVTTPVFGCNSSLNNDTQYLTMTNSLITITGSDADAAALVVFGSSGYLNYAWDGDSNDSGDFIIGDATGSTIKFTNSSGSAKTFYDQNGNTYNNINHCSATNFTYNTNATYNNVSCVNTNSGVAILFFR